MSNYNGSFNIAENESNDRVMVLRAMFSAVGKRIKYDLLIDTQI